MSTGGMVINGSQNTEVKKMVTEDDDLDSGESKRGGLCCFCCCDYRRAVIIMAILSIIFGIIGLATYTYQASGVINAIDVINDDGDGKRLADAFDEYNRVTLVLFIISLITSLSALAGAIIYNKFMVAVHVVWLIINFIIYAININKITNILSDVLTQDNSFVDNSFEDNSFDVFGSVSFDAARKVFRLRAILNQVFGALFTILWVYPAVKFCLELHSGVMSTKTYPREKASCCCV